MCDFKFSSSHVFKKQEEKGEVNSSNIHYFTQYVQNIISMCNH